MIMSSQILLPSAPTIRPLKSGLVGIPVAMGFDGSEFLFGVVVFGIDGSSVLT